MYYYANATLKAGDRIFLVYDRESDAKKLADGKPYDTLNAPRYCSPTKTLNFSNEPGDFIYRGHILFEKDKRDHRLELWLKENEDSEWKSSGCTAPTLSTINSIAKGLSGYYSAAILEKIPEASPPSSLIMEEV